MSRIDVDDRKLIRRFDPVGKYRLSAIVGLHQPNHTLAEIVLDIPKMKDVLTEHTDAPGYVVAADQEFDVVQRRAGERDLLGRRDRDARPAAAGADNVEPQRRER